MCWKVFLLQMIEETIIIPSMFMQSEIEKKMANTTKKQKIFNVRKLPYKQFDNQKYLKYNCSPLLKREPFQEHNINNGNGKAMEYQFQIALMATPAYKELNCKYRELRDNQKLEKEEKLKSLRAKEEELEKYVAERERLSMEKYRLLRKRDELRGCIEQLRQRRQALRAYQNQRHEQYQVTNMQYLANMVMGLQYQGGVDIDPDNMTYQQLLQLQEKMGKVSKGLNQQQFKQLQKIEAGKQHEQQLCSICYEHIKTGEDIHKLTCKHIFHCQCIKQWLMKEKVCPMCKQELNLVDCDKSSV